MADTTRTPCTPDNCGDNFPACGQVKTYNHCKCRCDKCREANAEASRRYYENNREKRAEKNRKQYAKNREERKRYQRAYAAENRDAVLAQAKVHYEKNRVKILRQKRDYRAENADAIREAHRKWKENNPDYVREYRERNPELFRGYRQSRRALLLAAWVEDVDPLVVFERNKYVCQRCYIKCQVTTYPASDYATLDHIIPLEWGVFRGGFHSYANTQTLCYSCNSVKGNRE